MNMQTRLYFLVALLISASSLLLGQSIANQATVLKPIWVEAKVLGILESHNALVVLQISRVDSTNNINLKAGSEVLVEFVFGTKKSDGEPKLPGVKPEQIIKAEIDGKFNHSSGQWDYRVFRYDSVK